MLPHQLAEYYLSFFTNEYLNAADMPPAPRELKELLDAVDPIGYNNGSQVLYDALFEIAKSESIEQLGNGWRGDRQRILSYVYNELVKQCHAVENSHSRRMTR